jgi:hypothetical protein
MSDVDGWVYTEEKFKGGLHIGPCAECERLQEQLEAANDRYNHRLRAATEDVRLERDQARDELEQLRAALEAYHELAPALAECANECGEARLYSDLNQANVRAHAALAQGAG